MTKLELKYPVEYQGEKISVLNVRRPVVRDLLASESAGGSDAVQDVQMMAALCDLAPDAVHALDLADYVALQKIVQGFTGSAAGTQGG